ncbi:MAG: precorrin-6Y C5,15-methyltransferase (decarboxylating) subunit CbiT, partial [Veillonella tobetsuensis]|nr:precorrin-6Y C5,15-methyltransferase (decarboxylating) subunit CbiT [Veillonella tobetsuensis]
EGYQMSISRYRKAGPYHLLDPLSPIFIVSATRIAEGE